MIAPSQESPHPQWPHTSLSSADALTRWTVCKTISIATGSPGNEVGMAGSEARPNQCIAVSMSSLNQSAQLWTGKSEGGWGGGTKGRCGDGVRIPAEAPSHTLTHKTF